jgi:hypothetical protein
MATWDDVCAIAAALPGAELDAVAEGAAWRLNGRVLLRRHPRLDGDTRTHRGEVIAIRTSPAEREALLAEDGETFFVTDHWGRSRNPSILVDLATVSSTQLEELVTEAWQARSTWRQRAALEQLRPTVSPAFDEFLTAVRGVDGLKETTPRHFAFKSRAFLHFHGDDEHRHADVRLGGDWEQRPAVTGAELAALLDEVRAYVAANRSRVRSGARR